LKNKRADFGQVQGKFALRVAPTSPSDESKGISHDRAGLLSVPRGGGVFDFSITLGPAIELDESNIVIGQIVSDDAEGASTLSFINQIPVVAYVGQGQGNEASRSKSCSYGSAETFCSQMKPIKKITIQTSVQEAL
jgi:hypothetical protein